MLTEIYRRLNFFHKGDLNEIMLLSEFPHRAKCLVKLGLIKPYSKETQRVYNWYNLTDKGKLFFSNYIEKVDEKKNYELFNGEIKTFNKLLCK